MNRHQSPIRPLGLRLAELAASAADREALVVVDAYDAAEVLRWRELDDITRYFGERLDAALAGDAARTVVTVDAGNSLACIVRILSALRQGLRVVLLDPQLAESERHRHVEAIGNDWGPVRRAEDLIDWTRTGRPRGGPEPLYDPASGGYGLMTGGSTGLPRLVIRPGVPCHDARRSPPPLLAETRWRPAQRQLVVGPLHHTAPFSHLLGGLLDGNTVVVLEAYLPELMFAVVDRHQVEWIQLTPTHMRLAEAMLSDNAASLRSVRGVLHTAAPCPEGTKRAWIEALGPSRIFEVYGATEGIGFTLCRGEEWLERPGTVGRGYLTRLAVLDQDHRPVPNGEVGTVYMRTVGAGVARYRSDRGGPQVRGFRTAGDRGSLDDGGYLFLAGRDDDMVVVGGENVYLVDVERVLMAHATVADAMAFAEPHDALGSVISALVVSRPPADDTAAQSVLRHCRLHLRPSMVPRSVTIVDELPRTTAGKMQRWRSRRGGGRVDG